MRRSSHLIEAGSPARPRAGKPRRAREVGAALEGLSSWWPPVSCPEFWHHVLDLGGGLNEMEGIKREASDLRQVGLCSLADKAKEHNFTHMRS